MIRAYHFVGTNIRDGSPVPADGAWLQFDGKISICKRGLHASRHVSDACKYAPGSILCLVDLDGEIQEQEDKICASRRRIVARFDAMELLQKDARESARSVLHLWNAPDAVVNFLKTGNKELALKARRASYAAARAADATYDATYAANRKRLQDAVATKFDELLK